MPPVVEKTKSVNDVPTETPLHECGLHTPFSSELEPIVLYNGASHYPKNACGGHYFRI